MPGEAEQRGATHGEGADRLHQRRHIGAHQIDLFGGQPRLVEKYQYGPSGGSSQRSARAVGGMEPSGDTGC
ncbi:hypothetical protein SVIO_047950 [Streptomyces violaceusniger]|uniref:Uncharacterized protein n=1 Tax=Streptomyces violaceusniger TaxID=68280 RepID=A0A4D4KZA0_STRVO|nr:hypothetical protein SVIO_047950 [Streptomyces violaceusniger]